MCPVLADIIDQIGEYRDECAKLNVGLVPMQSLSREKLISILNKLMLAHSQDTALILTALPFPALSAEETLADAYVAQLKGLTASLPPTVLVCNGENFPYISTSL